MLFFLNDSKHFESLGYSHSRLIKLGCKSFEGVIESNTHGEKEMAFLPNWIQKKFRIILILTVSLFLFSSNKSRENSTLEESPISLTSSDGTGLILKSYESNTVLDGFFAFTEIKLSFYNPENRIREGRFRITLPDNAHLARFAMEIGNTWQEGEVVEKEKATRVYEDFLHKKQDPALLETDAGNEFSARIFPIPPNAEKKLILSYSTTLGGFPPVFRLPVVGLPSIEDFKLRVMFDGDEFRVDSETEKINEDTKLETKKLFSFTKKNYKPKHNFIFHHKINENLLSINGKNFVLKLVPISESIEKKIQLDNLVVLVDTSASSTLHFKETVAKLETLIDKLELKNSYIFGFDTGLVSYGKGAEGLRKLGDVEPLGSSNISKSIGELGKIIGEQSYRLLLVSDGVLTSGLNEQNEIREFLKKQSWINRLDVIVPSAYKDKSIIDSLLTSGKENGVSFQMDNDVSQMVRRLTYKVSFPPNINVDGVDWIYAEELNSLQPGDSITVFGAMKQDRSLSQGAITLDGKPIKKIISVTTESLLLDREVTSARINRLLKLSENESNADVSKGLKLQAIELSTGFRLQCPLTSFLVLETPEDYMRFQITRNALKDIMTVGLGGIEVINRKAMVSYDFLNPENVEKRRMEDEERIRNALEKQKVAEKRKSKDDNKKMEAAPIHSSDGISSDEYDLEKEESVNKPTTETTSNPPGEVQAITSVALPKNESLPNRNTYHLESNKNLIRPTITSEKREKIEPYVGNLKEFYQYLHAGENLKALAFAKSWKASAPDDILALLALGDAYFALGDRKNAERAYSSFVDYFPKRADIRRWSGEKLFSIAMYDEAIDSLSKALKERPDHPSTYHLLAIAYMKTSQWKKAYETLMLGLHQSFPTRFQAVHDVLYDDLDLLYSIVKKGDRDKLFPSKEISSNFKWKELGAEIRFVLVWETDANDVDFHIYDKDNNHAFYSQKILNSGGELYADITGGYGPECFRIINPKAFPYRLEAHYYSRGPMGYGMGALQVIRFDGEQKLDVETRNFVIMNDGAYINLGKVK